MTKKVYFLVLFLMSAMYLQAQKLTVESMKVAQGDLSASVQPRNDRNGQPCGLVKVRLAAPGAEFDGNIIGEVKYKTGEYWVYMTKGSYLLQIRHPEFLPLDVSFRDYGIRGVEPKTTYVLTLLKPMNASQEKDDSRQLELAVGNNLDLSGARVTMTFAVGDVSFNMIRVDGGTFQMGHDEEGNGYYLGGSRGPKHTVTISKAFFIGETEVTQALWLAVMGMEPTPDGWEKRNGKGMEYPAYNIKWINCKHFIDSLNTKLSNQLPPGMRFRLPTEAEWEFAARGGNQSQGYVYSGSNDYNSVAWCSKSKKSHEVKRKESNELGLYDMSGNVYEWCEDLLDKNYYAISPQIDPINRQSGVLHVHRGGSWLCLGGLCRVDNRGIHQYSVSVKDHGLRLVLQ